MQKEKNMRHRRQAAAKNADKLLLGELYADKVYLNQLLENPKIKDGLGKSESDDAVRKTVRPIRL